ncbi:unnamed protein product [Linum trigynum]|uniref:Uncharacterized protein n=1 Tax=Linum trigynum TaxID=586398 RepID=A0AAV2D7B3_9ROSI
MNSHPGDHDVAYSQPQLVPTSSAEAESSSAADIAYGSSEEANSPLSPLVGSPPTTDAVASSPTDAAASSPTGSLPHLAAVIEAISLHSARWL